MPQTAQSQLDRDAPANLCEACARNVPLQDDNKYGTSQHGPIVWDDTCPDYPTLETSARDGCDMCEMLREALLRRNINYKGGVKIKGRYCYTFHRPDGGYNYVQGGELAYFQCRLTDNEGGELAAIMFSMTSDNNQICGWLRTNGHYRTHPLHKENVKGVKRVLKSCARKYKQFPTEFNPTRLVHVGSNDGTMPRLVATVGARAQDPGIHLEFMRTARSTDETERVLIQRDIHDDSEDVTHEEDTEWVAPDDCGISTYTVEKHELSLGVLECWHGSTLAVCSRSLTDRQDLFPSIAGFAESCAAILNDTYLAGMWKSFIHFGLIWRVMQPPAGTLKSALAAKASSPDRFVAPSWSWASQERPIRYCAKVRVAKPGMSSSRRRRLSRPDVIQDETEPDEGILRRNIQNRSILEAAMACFNELRSMVTTKDYLIATESTNTFGRLTGASIKLLAKVIPLEPEIFLTYPGADRRLFQESPPLYGHKGHLYPDWDFAGTGLDCYDGLSLLLTAVCCLETSQAYKEMFEPGSTFKAGPLVNPRDRPSPSTRLCRWCLDDTHYGHHYGIVIHPTRADPGRYHRVGAFVLYGGFNGGRIFDNVPPTEITLV
ncbi:hypothetical protein PG989_001438 [Apiospora arundinis]